MAYEPKEFRNFYWHMIKYPVKPKEFWEKAETQEIDEPFRYGSGRAIRIPFTSKAVVIGKWQKSYTESEALTYAIRGRYVEDDELDWDVVRFGNDGAENNAAQKN